MASAAFDYFTRQHGLNAHAAVQDTDDFSDDESSLDEYFDNYVPLSSLPTPPLSTTAPTPLEENVFGEGDPQVMGKHSFIAEGNLTNSEQVQQDILPTWYPPKASDQGHLPAPSPPCYQELTSHWKQSPSQHVSSTHSPTNSAAHGATLSPTSILHHLLLRPRNITLHSHPLLHLPHLEFHLYHLPKPSFSQL
jgi:hypothetical protein